MPLYGTLIVYDAFCMTGYNGSEEKEDARRKRIGSVIPRGSNLDFSCSLINGHRRSEGSHVERIGDDLMSTGQRCQRQNEIKTWNNMSLIGIQWCRWWTINVLHVCVSTFA